MRTDVKNRAYLRNPLKIKIHDEAPHIMYLTDVDAVLFRKRSRILRILECKYRNEPVRNSQKTVLPLLAKLVRLGVEMGILSVGSGVFVTRFDDGDTSVLVEEVDGGFKEEIPLGKFLADWATCMAK